MPYDHHRILIVQTAFIGDVILTTPLIGAIRKCFPESELSILVTPGAAPLLRNNPHLTQLMVYDKRGKDRGLRGLFRMAGDLRARRFDLALMPHRSLRTALLTYLARMPRRIGFCTSPGAWLYSETVSYRKDAHEIERNLDLLAGLDDGLEPLSVNRRPELFPSEEDQRVVTAFLHRTGVKDGDTVVAVAPGSVWATKRWLPEGFAGVADRLSAQETEGVKVGKTPAKIVFVGGHSDRELCEHIAGLMSIPPVIAAGEMTLLQSAALIDRCKVLLCNDTAPMHMAVAMGTPVVALFGPTVPSLGFAPYGEGHTVIERELDCRPCGVHGGQRCPKRHFRCMREITPDEVLREITSKIDPNAKD